MLEKLFGLIPILNRIDGRAIYLGVKVLAWNIGRNGIGNTNFTGTNIKICEIINIDTRMVYKNTIPVQH
jgi:hypothetical protein